MGDDACLKDRGAKPTILFLLNCFSWGVVDSLSISNVKLLAFMNCCCTAEERSTAVCPDPWLSNDAWAWALIIDSSLLICSTIVRMVLT